MVQLTAYSYGYYPYGLYFDWTYLLVIIGFIICLIAQGVTKSTASRYSYVKSSSGLTGRQAAQIILERNGIYNVQVNPIEGDLTDHYDPRTKCVNLAQESYDETSLTGIGVAAHECGHAIQDHEGYALLRMRSALVPVVNFGSNLSWPLLIIGLIFSIQPLVTAGIVLFSLAVLFQLVTLPVEINASHRALVCLKQSGMVEDRELKGMRKVLTAAAMTYVAALASSILQMLRLILLSRNSRRN